jgi:hypothetical protein
VALCQARISTKPLWGFSSSNPYHSQSRAEQNLCYKVCQFVVICMQRNFIINALESLRSLAAV